MEATNKVTENQDLLEEMVENQDVLEEMVKMQLASVNWKEIDFYEYLESFEFIQGLEMITNPALLQMISAPKELIEFVSNMSLSDKKKYQEEVKDLMIKVYEREVTTHA